MTTIGILYAGDLGLHLGKLLLERGEYDSASPERKRRGLRVLTTVAGRSERTRQRAEAGGFEIVPSLADVLQQSEVVLSLVPPAAAVDVAEDCRTALARWQISDLRLQIERPDVKICNLKSAICNRLVYVDLNSIAPDTVRRVAGVFNGSGIEFVDGAVHGMASQLRTRGTLYLSGPAAAQVAELFGRALRVRVLGDEPGQASAFKMMISGLNKGVVALVLEMALAARQAGFLDDLLACYRDAYPGIMALVDRLLPTYPQHARRRGDELREVSQTLRSLGLDPCLVDSARRLTEKVGRLRLDEDERAWSVTEVIERVFENNPLVPNHEAGIPGPLPLQKELTHGPETAFR